MPPGTALQCKAQFKSRRRAAGESLATLADELRKLVGRAYPNMPDNDREELVRDQFIESLTPVSLRVRLQENPPATVQAAVEVALHLERVWGDLAMPSGASQRLVGPYGEAQAQQLVVASVAPPAASPAESELVKLLSRLETRLERLEDFRSRRPPPACSQRGPVTCFSCGKVGHYQSECRSRPGVGRGRPRGPPPTQRPPVKPSGNGK